MADSTRSHSSIPNQGVSAGESITSGQPDTYQTIPTDRTFSRLKKISDHPFECLIDSQICSCRFTYGYKCFCSWMLQEQTAKRGTCLPCVSGGKELCNGDTGTNHY